MPGLIGKKVGMTSIYSQDGKNLPCTVLEVGPCVVTQVKTNDVDGYNAIQLGWGEAKDKNTSKALQGHTQKANTSAKRKFVEFTDFKGDLELGQVLTADLFAEGDFVDVAGTSKGKGFQGVVKRHGFAGGPRTHGQKHTERAPGSIGATGPQRVFKGTRMGGRMGTDRVTVKNLTVVDADPKTNTLFIKGAIPGRPGTLVEIKA